MASKLPDWVGWYLKLQAVWTVPVFLLAIGMYLFVTHDTSFGSLESNIRFLALMSIVFAYLGGGYFVGKGLIARREWARRTVVWGCWLGAVVSVIVSIYQGVFIHIAFGGSQKGALDFLVLLPGLLCLCFGIVIGLLFNTAKMKTEFGVSVRKPNRNRAGRKAKNASDRNRKQIETP